MNRPLCITAPASLVVLTALLGCPTEDPPSPGPIPVYENPTLEITVLKEITSFKSPNTGVYAEVPTVLFQANGERYAMMSAHCSDMAPIAAGKSPLTDTGAFGEPETVGSAQIEPPPNMSVKSPEEVNNYDFIWGRSYYGFYDTAVFTVNGRQYIAAVAHGENKNYYYHSYKYKNSVKPLETEYGPLEYSGDVDGTGWKDNFPNYFGFVSICVAPLDDPNWKQLYRFDKGPIIWPGSGYLMAQSNTTAATHGVRHPRLFIDNDYMYLYYLDEGGSEAGRGQGIKAARSPLAELGAPGTWNKYYEGGFTEDGLPANFTKDNIRDFLAVKSGRAMKLVSGNGIYSLSAAKLNNSPYYIGVYKEGTQKHVVKLTISTDLVNWSRGVEVPGTEITGGWNDSNMQYPTLFNAALDDHYRIDADGFYIFGSHHTDATNYIKVSIAVKEDPDA